VADLDALLAVLNGPELAPLVRSIDVTTVLDAGSFLGDFGRIEAHLAAQITPAGRVVINKADLVSLAVLRTVAGTVRALAPASVIVAARFALVDESAVLIGSPPLRAAEAAPALMGNVLELHPHHAARGENPSRFDQDHVGHVHGAGKRGEGPGPAGTHGALGLTSWSLMLPANCSPDDLFHVLEAVAAGEFGHVERVKGVARVGSGWVRFDVAGRRASMAAFAANKDEAARVVAIGREVDEERLAAAFEACAIAEAAA
jgi:G3E family GTPase